MAATSRPSDLRREALNADLTVPLVSNFFPIERYYDAADKVFASFNEVAALAEQYAKDSAKSESNNTSDISHQSQLTDQALDEAYTYAKRYCMFCTDAIPQHNYFTAKRYRPLSVKHNKQINQVLEKLELLVLLMDRQEQRKKEALARAEEEKYAALQERVLAQTAALKKHESTSSGCNVAASALSKLELLRPTPTEPEPAQSSPPSYETAPTAKTKIPRDPSGEKEEEAGSQHQPSTCRYRLMPDSSEEDDSEEETVQTGALPLPMLPPVTAKDQQPTSEWIQAAAATAATGPDTAAAPPAYHQVAQQSARYNARSFLGPAAVASATGAMDAGSFLQQAGISLQQQRKPMSQEPVSEQRPKQQVKITKPQPPPKTKPMRVLQEEYKREYDCFIQNQRITVSGLTTYQGRVGSSTNGCTVISALTVAQHLRTSNGSCVGVADNQVGVIIDKQCGPILRDIRNKLGLGNHALIIPSDVHDHLVDKKILRQEDFAGAAGGNVMDPQHLGEFLKLIAVGDDGKHGQCPAGATLFFREHVISIVKRPIVDNNGNTVAAYYDLYDSLPVMHFGGRTCGTRTRCKDLQSLQVLLRWYTSRKFSESNCDHIDRNPWHDSMADFDPRVFQGFIWAKKS